MSPWNVIRVRFLAVKASFLFQDIIIFSWDQSNLIDNAMRFYKSFPILKRSSARDAASSGGKST